MVFNWLTAGCLAKFTFRPLFIQQLHLRSFLFSEDITGYADDTTPYSNSKNGATVLENKETKGKEVFNWFSLNYLKANPDRSQLLLTSKD